jgi:regulator of protease activity HflC (stomatin/prohibitin superfamily)
METLITLFFAMPILIIVLVVLVIIIRQVNQYERGVKFTMGKFTSMVEPGWRIIIPIFQSMTKVDMRLKAVDVLDQKTITKDNISVNVNAVLYYKVVDASKAILQVQYYQNAVEQFAQTTMRSVVGEVTLDELLQGRDKIAERIQGIVEATAAAWGLDVENVELKDISLPPEMERTIAKQAEAEREKRAVIITSEGELGAAKNMSDAARILAETPGALHLRTLQSINDMSSDQSNTVIYMIPVEILKAFEGFTKKNS